MLEIVFHTENPRSRNERAVPRAHYAGYNREAVALTAGVFAGDVGNYYHYQKDSHVA